MQVCIFPDAAGVAVATADRIQELVREKPDALWRCRRGTRLSRRTKSWRAGSRRARSISLGRVGVCRRRVRRRAARYAGHEQRLLSAAPARAAARAAYSEPRRRGPQQHIAAFADAIRRAGGIDLCVLGVGRNGHIAFNEPGSESDSAARVVQLEAASREAHAASFGGIERVPERGMTLAGRRRPAGGAANRRHGDRCAQSSDRASGD